MFDKPTLHGFFLFSAFGLFFGKKHAAFFSFFADRRFSVFLRSSLPNCPEYQYADQSAPFPCQNHRAHGGGAGRVQEQANFDAANKAKVAGADVVKQWSAVLDGKTRDTHRELDHQIREMDKPFETHGKKAMYPHDFGDPAEDCNCRCTLLTRARAAMDKDELAVMQKRAEFFGLDKTDSFAEFKEKYLKAAESVEKIGKSGIINMDLTGHATERMKQREVTDTDVEDTKKNPLYTKPVVVDAQGRKSQIIIGKKATICINPESGRIITTWKTGSKIRKKYGGGD